MKNKILSFCFAVCTSLNSFSQKQIPQLLKEPADWSFERFNLPPEFAPNIPFHGAEELRFSPWTFQKDSLNYFTYAFVAQFDDTKSVSKDDIRNYLLEYFKGLCSKTAKDRHLVVDTSKIIVAIEKKNSGNDEVMYAAALNVFGVFANGAEVKLNMEIKVFKNEEAQKMYLLFVASSQPETAVIWNKLHQIQKDFSIPK